MARFCRGCPTGERNPTLMLRFRLCHVGAAAVADGGQREWTSPQRSGCKERLPASLALLLVANGLWGQRGQRGSTC